MSATEDYLIRIGKALADDDASEISDLALELYVFLNDGVASLTRSQRNQINTTSSGLRQMRAKLLSRREAQDSQVYGGCGLGAMTDSIHQLEEALGAGRTDDELKDLYNRIDHIYANTLDSYVDGLCGWGFGTGDSPSDEQTRLRIEKLRYYRDEEYRKLKLADAQKANVKVTQSTQASAQANVAANISTTIERIDSLPESSLSENDKTLLKGMIADLAEKDSRKREGKLQKLINWLGDKGTDVFIAAMPHIVQIIKTQMGV